MPDQKEILPLAPDLAHEVDEEDLPRGTAPTASTAELRELVRSHGERFQPILAVLRDQPWKELVTSRDLMDSLSAQGLEMSERTLRLHLAELAEVGLIARHGRKGYHLTAAGDRGHARTDHRAAPGQHPLPHGGDHLPAELRPGRGHRPGLDQRLRHPARIHPAAVRRARGGVRRRAGGRFARAGGRPGRGHPRPRRAGGLPGPGHDVLADPGRHADAPRRADPPDLRRTAARRERQAAALPRDDALRRDHAQPERGLHPRQLHQRQPGRRTPAPAPSPRPSARCR